MFTGGKFDGYYILMVMKQLKTIHEILRNEHVPYNGAYRPFNQYGVKHSANHHAQNSEDSILHYLVHKISPVNRYYIEFGAWDGYNFSNVAHFRENLGWNGLLFESDISKIVGTRLNNLFHETITDLNVNDIFAKYDVPGLFDILSIDVDGNDSYILEKLDTDRYHPSLIIIEHNQGLPNHVPIRAMKDVSDIDVRGYFGTNINMLYDIALAKGYKFVTTVTWNVIFVDSNKFPLLNIPELDKSELMKIHDRQFKWDFYRNRMLGYNDLWETY